MDLGTVRCNEELYTLACLQTLSCLGDCGRYNESDQLAWVCIWHDLTIGRMVNIAGTLYDIAWNLEHRQGADHKNVLYLFKLAYAAALLCQDKIGQKHIQKHCLESFGFELDL